MRPYWVTTQAIEAGDVVCLTPDGRRVRRAEGEPAPTTEMDFTGHGELIVLPIDEIKASLGRGATVALMADGAAICYLVPPPEAPDPPGTQETL